MYKICCLVAAGMLAAGCSQQSGAPDQDADAPQAGISEAIPDPDGGPGPHAAGSAVIMESYPQDFALDQPIPEEAIGVDLRLAGPAGYRPDGDALVFDVEVANRGRAALVSKGSLPVQLGVTLAGPEGVDVAPGRRDFHRVQLPLIVPGHSFVVQVQVPAEELLGLGVKVEAVQEKVGWFGRQFDQPVLDVGTFNRCDGNPATLCDASGTPLPTR